jgi:hypothetical protein
MPCAGKVFALGEGREILVALKRNDEYALHIKAVRA